MALQLALQGGSRGDVQVVVAYGEGSTRIDRRPANSGTQRSLARYLGEPAIRSIASRADRRIVFSLV